MKEDKTGRGYDSFCDYDELHVLFRRRSTRHIPTSHHTDSTARLLCCLMEESERPMEVTTKILDWMAAEKFKKDMHEERAFHLIIFSISRECVFKVRYRSFLA